MRAIRIITLLTIFCAANLLHAADFKNYRPFDSQQRHLLINSESRFVTSLAGKWNRGVEEGDWNKVYVPYSDPYLGDIKYRRSLKIDPSVADKYIWHLYFLGADDKINLTINDQYVGKYFGGMTQFSVKIPNNLITTGINNFEIETLPATSGERQIRELQLYNPRIFNGMIREVFLMGTPLVWIDDMNYQTRLTGGGNGELSVHIDIASGDLSAAEGREAFRDSVQHDFLKKLNAILRVEVLDARTGSSVAASGDINFEIESERTVSRDLRLSIPDVKLWSPDSPDLYKIVVKVVKNGITIDDYHSNIGFRHVEVNKSGEVPQIFLNGKPFKIRAVTYVEDVQNLGQTLSAKIMEEDIRRIKTLGANTIKFKHQPPHPYFMYLCDEYGLMVLIDLPLYYAPANVAGQNEIKVRMTNTAKRYLFSYDNHPSVLGYGLYEGLDESSAEVRNLADHLISVFRSDTDKLIYKTVMLEMDGVFTDGFDFLVFCERINQANLTNIKASMEKNINSLKNIPLVFDYGTVIQPENHNGYSDPLSTEYQSYYIRSIYKYLEGKKIYGSIVSTYNDYLLNSPLLTANINNQYLYASGLVSRERQPRLSFNTLQTLFNQEKEPLLNAGSYSEKTPVSFIIIGVAMLIVIVFLANRFRRFREYLFRSLLRPYNFYADIRDQRIMSSVQTILLGLVISITIGIFFSSMLYFYRANELAQYVLMLLLPGDLVQEFLYRLIWMPEILIIFISAFFFLMIFIIAFIIRLFAFFMRARIFLNDTLTITVWAGSPFLLMLPFSIVLIRLLVLSPHFFWIFTLAMALLFLWVFFRMMRASAVVFDKMSRQVYIIGFIILLIILAVPLALYQYYFKFFSYIEYFTEVLLSQ
ncbi:MAG: glycoside hydrolase family 2 TIM barrel-domain containing protein [Candidatus Kapaibacterium sp.]